MRLTFVPFLCAAIFCACSSCATKGKTSTSPSGGPNEVALFIASDMRGYLGPCGCSENMRGGIARAADEIDAAKKEGLATAFVDAGGSLFRYPNPKDEQIPQEQRKAKAIAEAFRAMGIVARGVGERDLIQGDKFLQSLGLPELRAGEATVAEVGGHKFGFTSGATAEQLKAGAISAKHQGAEFVVGFAQVAFDEAQKLAQSPDLPLDLLVAARAEGELQGEDNKLLRTSVPLVEPQSKGRSLLRVDVTFGGDGKFELLKGKAEQEKQLAALDERIELLRAQVNEPMLNPELLKLRKDKLEELLKRRETLSAEKPAIPKGVNAFTVRFIPLETTVPDDPTVAKIVTAYDRDVGEMNLAWAKAHGVDCPPPSEAQPGYVGSEACKDCHEDSFPVWEASKHAHAYKTLEEKQKQYSLDCIGCHVTGYQKPGGVCRVDKVQGRAEVGCEACHGPGSKHVDDPDSDNISRGNDEKICLGCHDPENSPHFDFDAYLPKILGKGHEATAKK